MRSTSISPVEYVMEEYVWNIIGLFSQKRDVNSFCNVTVCCVKQYWFSDVKNSYSIKVFTVLEWCS